MPGEQPPIPNATEKTLIREALEMRNQYLTPVLNNASMKRRKRGEAHGEGPANQDVPCHRTHTNSKA